jgi:tellurite resistance protein TerC
LDNVVAAVALSDHILVVLAGVALGILALRWAASFFAVMVEKEPILLDAAYLLVLVIGLRFCLEHFFEFEIAPTVQFAVSLGILALAWLYAHWSPLRRLHPVVHRVRRVIYRMMTMIKQTLSFGAAKRVETES